MSGDLILTTSLRDTIGSFLSACFGDNDLMLQTGYNLGKYGNVSSRYAVISDGTKRVKLMQRYSRKDGSVTSESISFPRN